MTASIVLIWLVVFIVLLIAFKLLPKKAVIDYKALAREQIANEYPEFNISNAFLRRGRFKEIRKQVHGIAIDKDAELFCLIDAGKPQQFTYNDLIECQLVVKGKPLPEAKISRLVKFVGTPTGDKIIELYDRFGVPKLDPIKLLGMALNDPNKPPPPPRKFGLLQFKGADLRVDLRIIVKDIEKPFRVYAFIEEPEPDEDVYKAALKEGETWFEAMSKVAKKADEEELEPDIKALCIADELSKLMALKQEGVLTEDEYRQVKDRLVSA